jgi:hypothetical protein
MSCRCLYWCVGRMTAGFVCLFVCLDVRVLLCDSHCHNDVAGQYTQISLCHYRDCTHVQSNTVLCTQQYLGNVNFAQYLVDSSLINFCSSLLSLAAGGWWQIKSRYPERKCNLSTATFSTLCIRQDSDFGLPHGSSLNKAHQLHLPVMQTRHAASVSIQ